MRELLLDHDGARAILEEMLSSGADSAEIFMESRTQTHLKWEEGRLHEASAGTDAGAGLRLGAGDTAYYASGNSTDRASLVRLARTLASSIRGEGRRAAAPFLPVQAPERCLVRIPPATVPLERKVDVLRRADEKARSADARIHQVSASLLDTDRVVLVANSQGVHETDRTCYSTLSVFVVAREGGLVRSGYEAVSETSGFETFDEDVPERTASEAARVALLQLSALPAPSGTFTVVLSSKAGGTMVHEACGHGFEADFIEKGLSVYAGKIGQKVASDLVTVFDDGTMPRKRGTNRIDDEGVPVSKTVLIEGGILRGYLHSLRTARKMGMAPTGNGRRESYRFLPIPRMRNTCIAPGATPPEQIIASVRDGIFVADIGGGEVDIVTGNFVFHCVEAYIIRDGTLGEAIRDATLTGRGPDVLSSIDMVGSDLGFGVGTCGKDGQNVPVSDAQPTIRIPAIVVGGTA